MTVAKKLSRTRRVIIRSLIFIFGDRALLQTGYPGRIAGLFKCPPAIVRPSPYTLYELNPAWRSVDGRSRHNSIGFRGAEISTSKPAGRLRVVCMGESSTYCSGIDDDRQTYPYRLGEHLKNSMPDADIEVVNGGVGGYTSIENILRLLFHVAPLSPDLIVYYYTHNDVHPRRLKNLSRDYREYSCSWYEPATGGGLLDWCKRRKNLATAYVGNIVRRRGGGRRNSLHILSNPPAAFRANIRALTLLANATAGRVLFVNPNYRPEHPDDASANAVWEHRRIVADAATKMGVHVVDLSGSLPYLWEGGGADRTYYDDVHFNESGADLAAAIIAAAIVENNLLASSAEKPFIY